MHRTTILASALTVLLAFSTSAFAEKTSATLVRNANSQLQLTETLSEDLYRQEPHQVPYTVQEPYEATETYYVDVPYQDTETYYEDVPYQETESYTEYEDYWEREERCHNETRNERQCRDREDCHVVPGRGEGGGPRRECTRVPECHDVPRNERVCNWEQVRHQRPVHRTRTVTRYRKEARTRTVTKYRQEARTRTVTKYRDVEVCCKTEYRDVYDRTYNVPVTVIFPADTQLQGAEQEQFTVRLTGTEAAPAVELTPASVIFGYQILRQEVRGGGVVIELKTTPLYTQAQLGAATIKGLCLQETNSGSLIRFNDEGLKARVQSRYAYQIREVGSAEVLLAGELASSGAQVQIPLALVLEDMKEYQLELRLQRQGIPLAGLVDEVLTAIKKVTPLKNADLHLRRDQINTFEIRGEGLNSKLLFRDQSPTDEGVRTVYKIEIILGGETGAVVATKEIAREAVPLASKGFFKIGLAQDMGISSSLLNEKVRRRKLVTARVTTTRENPRLNNGAPVVLQHVHVQEIEAE